MTYVLTSTEMRAADAQASAASSETVLMRAAGMRIAELIREMIPAGGTVVAFAGPGNNGGDAFATLAVLNAGYRRIVYEAESSSASEARADAKTRAQEAGVVVRALPTDDDTARAAVAGATLAVDGLFGTGSRLPLGEAYRAAARALDRDRVPVLALDIPSGVDGDTGARSDDAVRASVTIALAALKPGLLLEPGRECAGEVWIGDIGIDASILASHARTFEALDSNEFIAMLPQRSAETDKRSAGAPLVVAGSEQFPGAAVLCALGAARAGAGYVTVASSPAAAPTLRTHLIEQVVVTFADASAKEAAADLADVASRNSAIAIGPGLALDDWTGQMIRSLVELTSLPIVLDASALFHFSKNLDLLRNKQCVVTPHAGEFARLSGKGTIRAGERVERIREFVERTGVTTLLKGSDTLIYDGSIVHINPTGSSALATAGTGDVLTGIIATLLSQGLKPVDAARTAAYWHGLSGRYAARERHVGVIAGDVAKNLAAALPERKIPEPLSRYV